VYAFVVGRIKDSQINNPRFVFGIEPLLNYKYLSLALRRGGYDSQSIVTDLYSITSISDFDVVLAETKFGRFNTRTGNVLIHFQYLFHFMSILLRKDIVVTSTMGYIVAHINVGLLTYRVEPYLFRLAKMKTIIIPYGGDAYVYRRIDNPSTMQALLNSYPEGAKNQNKISKRVDFWVCNADYFLPSGMALEGFGRNDFISPNLLCIDLSSFDRHASKSRPEAGLVTITHAPNHRGAKGTDNVILAVERLKARGLKVDLVLLEGLSNAEVLKIMAETSDIHVDQILMNGYGLNAIEAMAFGLPVVGHIEGNFADYFTKFSWLNECPIVNSSIDTIEEVLENLILNETLREKLRDEGLSYVRKYHSYDSFLAMLQKLQIISSS